MRRIGSFCLGLMVALTTILPYEVIAAPNGTAPIEKEDEVLITTDASGNIIDQKASVVIAGADSSTPIKDKTVLSDIKNISGEETFTQESDGTIVWNNEGKDINYIGTLDAELPLSMKVSYYINDQEVTPEEIAGKTGHVKVVYSFENHEEVDVTIDGKKYSTYVPLLTVTTICLPMDGFYNVESLDGGLIVKEFGNQYFLLGVASPGTSESLQLDLLGLDQYIQFPTSFGFTADVNSFELPSAITCVTPHVLDRLDMSFLDTPNGVENKIDELVAATEQLMDGSDQVANGSDQLSAGISQFMSAFRTGMKKLSDGSIQLDNQLYDLESKKNALKGQAGELISQLDAILVQLDSIVLPDVNSIFTPELTTAQEKLKEDAENLKLALEAMKTQVEELQALTDQVDAILAQLNELYPKVNGIDLDQIVIDATELAKNQAKEAAQKKFAEMGLPDTMVDSIIDEILASIDISSVVEEPKAVIEEAKQVLDEALKIEIPEFNVEDIDLIIQILQDMEEQFTVLEAVSAKQGEIVELLNSAHAFVDSVKSNSPVLKQKSKELLSGLDFADSVIQSAHSYINTLKNSVSEANNGSDRIVNGANELSDGAQRLADGTEQYYEDGILTAADFAREATIKAFINRSKAHISAADLYTNITGIDSETRGSIRFTIRTEGISIAD